MHKVVRAVAAVGQAIATVAGGAAAPDARASSHQPETTARAERNQVAIIAAVTATGYYLGALFGLSLQLVPSGISSLWPSNAFLLGVLLLTSHRYWWLFLVAALPAHLLSHGPSGVPLQIMLIQFAGNVAQAVLGALAFQYLAGERARLDRLRTIVLFIVAAALLVPALVGLLTAGVFEATGWREELWIPWRIRFQSNALAVLTITPLIVVFWQRRVAFDAGLSPWRVVEAIALWAGLIVCGSWIAVTPDVESQSLPLLYLPVPLLLLAAVRFGLPGACLSVLALAIVRVWVAFNADSSLVPGEESVARTLEFGLFLLVSAIPLLLLATLLEERDKAQRTAHDVRDDLQKLMESTAAIPWQADPASSALMYIGPQIVDLLGYSQQDWGRRGFWFSRLHPDDRNVARTIFEKAAQSTETFRFDCRVISSSGKTHWIHNTVRCEHRHEKPFRLRGFMIDITDRRQAQSEAQRHRAEMAHINRVAAMGEFAASITHEVFQPLSAILYNAEAAELSLRAVPPALDDAREMVADIRKENQRAVEIIRRTRNLLQRHDIVLKPIDLNVLVGELLALLAIEAESRNVRIRFEPDPALPQVSGDRIHLQQVMTNLALNAFDAMAEQPEGERQLEVRTARSAEGLATVTVSDWGSGLADEVIPKLFEPFFTTKSNGLGMGLSITRTIVEAHHGRIRAENNPDGGATFILDLPLDGRS